MNVLIVGSGGREHAIAIEISKSPKLTKLYSMPGNPGINLIAEKANINSNDYPDIASFCSQNKIELVVIGPEQPLADGMSDFLRLNNINVFGPSKYCASLESSKAFAKDFMKKHSIPTAEYMTFNYDESNAAMEYLNNASYPIVIKADGLAAGKGVVIAENPEIALQTVKSFFDGLFNDAGKTIVIEEFMDGEEASILAVTDGTDFITLAPAQDHKRIYDGDIGPNTGGMGAYAPAPVVNEIVMEAVRNKIIKPVIDNLKNDGFPFVGCLYAGLMIKNNEPKVVEFNVRFGDPETQAVLPLFEGDFLQLLYSAAVGKLDFNSITNPVSGAACCVVLSSDGYPGKFEKGFEITGIDDAIQSGTIVYQAGTKISDEKLVTDGGRVIGVCAVAANLKDAIDNAYQGVDKIKFSNKFFRKDIAHRALNKSI